MILFSGKVGYRRLYSPPSLKLRRAVHFYTLFSTPPQPITLSCQYFYMYWFLEHPIISGLIAALIFELLTIILRFGFKLNSPTHTKPLAKLTSGYRIHHGYPGAGMLMLIPIFPSPTIISSILIIAGLMLFLSDLIHHSLILPVFAGNHEFDLKYPPSE